MKLANSKEVTTYIKLRLYMALLKLTAQFTILCISIGKLYNCKYLPLIVNVFSFSFLVCNTSSAVVCRLFAYTIFLSLFLGLREDNL